MVVGSSFIITHKVCTHSITQREVYEEKCRCFIFSLFLRSWDGVRHGLARSGTEYGPLTDLPDWSFADGRPAPPMKGQLRRRQEREALSRRIVMLNSEVDRGMEVWREKQEEAKRMEEHKKSLLLKPKGKLLMKKKSQS
uniref:Large ribosomal subunit protein mL52 n=1 Tax=Oreochromis aureus TaxID=47969 RepID=A0AAZ1WXA8_OREAU